MNRSRLLLILAMLGGAAVMSGCETPTKGPVNPVAKPAPAGTNAGTGTMPGSGTSPVAPVAQAPVQGADQVILAEGIELYNKGQYNEALKRFNSADIAAGSKANQITALKYSAFSHCVSSRVSLCRQQFEKAFKLDPAFDLAAGEHGHPLWGPQYARAKKGAK